MFSSKPVLSARRNVFRQINRSRAALTAIAFGVVAMVLATGFIDWNLRFGRDNTIESQLGHLQLMKPGFLENGRADPYAYLLPPADNTERTALQALEGYQHTAPRLLITGLASSGEVTLSFIGEGIDPQVESATQSGLRFPEGNNLPPGDPKTVIVGRGLAQNLGLQLGAPLVLIANTESGGISAVEAKVVGIFESISQAYDDAALRIPIDLARELMRTEGEHLRLVYLGDVAAVPGALAHLKQALPADQVQVVPWTELADFYNKTSALFAKQVGVIYVIIAVIIVLSISNTMTMSVMERVGEIGTMMALGTRRSGILTLFLLEGLILGVVGVLLGLIVGSLLAVVLSAVGIPMPPGPGMSWGYDAGILLSPKSLLTAAGIAQVTTLAASLYPSWKASRLEIVDALRTRQ